MLNKLKYEIIMIFFVIAGLCLGSFAPDLSKDLSFIGSIFIKLLKVMIIPLIVSSIFLALARLQGDKLKRLGLGTILYYLTTSALAGITGLLVFNLTKTDSLNYGLTGDKWQKYDPSKLSEFSFGEMIQSFFSGNIFHSLSSGNIVQIVIFTLIIGVAALNIEKSKRDVFINLADAVQDLVAKIIHWIILVAPLGIFSLVANLVAKTDMSVFLGLENLFFKITAAASIHMLITLPLIAFFVGRFNPYKFILQVREALALALTSASSAATLPVSKQVLDENVGVKEETSSFILPLGATLNMDGSALYQSIVILFLGGMAGMDIAIHQQALIFSFVMISSAGTAGIPGGGLMMMGAVMEMVGIPLEYLGVYLLIDRLWDYPITMINVFGDLIGAKTVDRFIK